MGYKLHYRGGVLRLADGAYIPKDAINLDWQDYIVWLSLGNVPEAADAPPGPSQNDVDAAAARAYAKLAALMQMTPESVQAWVQANVTNVAEVQDAITTLAIAVAVLARRL
jgi:hypothetical protein